MEESQSAGGTTEHLVDNSETKDIVTHETHQRLLSQRKKDQESMRSVQAELAEFKAEKQDFEEKRLAEQGEFKKLLELRNTENAKLKEDKSRYEKEFIDAHKLNAFREKLPGKIGDSSYYSYVDLDSIVLDPESGAVDMASVDSVVNSFVEKHHRLFDTNDAKKLPNHASNANLVDKPIGEMSKEESSKIMQEGIKQMLAASRKR